MREDLTSLGPRVSIPRKRQYSVRPFYWSLVVFTVLAALSWAFGPQSSHEAIDGFSHPSALLLKRENGPEVATLTIPHWHEPMLIIKYCL